MILGKGINVAPALTSGDAGRDIGTGSDWAIVCIVKTHWTDLAPKSCTSYYDRIYVTNSGMKS